MNHFQVTYFLRTLITLLWGIVLPRLFPTTGFTVGTGTVRCLDLARVLTNFFCTVPELLVIRGRFIILEFNLSSMCQRQDQFHATAQPCLTCSKFDECCFAFSFFICSLLLSFCNAFSVHQLFVLMELTLGRRIRVSPNRLMPLINSLRHIQHFYRARDAIFALFRRRDFWSRGRWWRLQVSNPSPPFMLVTFLQKNFFYISITYKKINYIFSFIIEMLVSFLDLL